MTALFWNMTPCHSTVVFLRIERKCSFENWEQITPWHGVISQNNVVLNRTTVITSRPAKICVKFVSHMGLQVEHNCVFVIQNTCYRLLGVSLSPPLLLAFFQLRHAFVRIKQIEKCCSNFGEHLSGKILIKSVEGRVTLHESL
jgi:hypothetical protein